MMWRNYVKNNVVGSFTSHKSPYVLKMVKKIEIQKRIVITQKDVDEIIEEYKKCSDTFGMAIGGWSGNRDDIIREIKNLTEIGKKILLMDCQFKQWEKKHSKDLCKTTQAKSFA